MTKVIQATFSVLPEISRAFGFGSYFRGEKYNDIDLLFLTESKIEELVPILRKLANLADRIEKKTGSVIHFTLLTEAEFHGHPVNDSPELTEIILNQASN